ncbi:hypothetical protein F5Y03DRAFT_391231 [Xylaria venustula]|nr:hypothetical protein F5Y03DRAFT_391231 [Xylaria venustula]
MSLFIYASSVSAFPTKTASEKYTLESRETQPNNFAKAFGTAMTIVVFVVVLGSIVICAFAQAWQQILDWSKGWLHKEKESWFCETHRGLPVPQFDSVEPETEPFYLYTQVWAPYRNPGSYC